MLSQENLNDFSRKVGKLPTLPGVAMQILRAMDHEAPSIKQISEIIASDAPLSAKVLKMVNSSFYGLSNRITSVHQAIQYLGLNTVKNLALSFSLLKGFAPKRQNSFDYMQFSKDSLVGAVAARLIAEKTNRQSGENAFFLGLLQNIGLPILAVTMPDKYGDVLLRVKSGASSWHEAENALLGINHMEVGEYVTHAWGLPASFTVPIRFHHSPDQLTYSLNDLAYLTKILHLSSLYINLFNGADPKAGYAEIEKCIQAYEFNPMIDKAAVAEEIAKGIKSVFPIFEMQIDADSYFDIIEMARNKLVDLSSELLNQVHDQTQCLDQLRQQAYLDGMTQLYNHKRFLEILHQEISRASRYQTALSIIMADVDHFKSINDFFGHQAGDHALKCVASHLKKLLRDSDHIARYGGEEFAMILPMTTLPEAMQAAERLRKSIESQKIVFHERSISLTMSFGVAAWENSPEMGVEGFLKRADEALYEAKNTGRNKSCCYQHQILSKAPALTVLVIDDEEVVLLTVTKMLERLGYAVIAAHSGREVIDLLQQKGIKIDMVITDMVMPDTKLDEIIGAIRAIHSGTKVVLSSGYDLSRADNEKLLGRTDAFLQKPYQLAELSRIVQATLKN